MYGEDHLKEIGSCDIPAARLPYFIELPPFRSAWADFGLTEADLHVLQLRIAGRPSAGAVVAGTNGVRKLRFSAPGSNVGKSGAYRVFYLVVAEHDAVFLIAALSKSERENLGKDERNAVAKRVAILKAELDEKGKA